MYMCECNLSGLGLQHHCGAWARWGKSYCFAFRWGVGAFSKSGARNLGILSNNYEGTLCDNCERTSVVLMRGYGTDYYGGFENI